MENVKIYLSGGMSGLSEEEQVKWRRQIRDAIMFGGYEFHKSPIFFDPTDYYSIFENYHKNNKEVFEYDLYNLRNSNVIIVNFNDTKSIGTAMELVLAKEYKIPVIGINKDGCVLHPWLIECTTRMCDTLKDAVEYIVDYFLN